MTLHTVDNILVRVHTVFNKKIFTISASNIGVLISCRNCQNMLVKFIDKMSYVST